MSIAAVSEQVGLSQAKVTTALLCLEEEGVVRMLLTGDVVATGNGSVRAAANCAAKVQENQRAFERSRLEMMRGAAELGARPSQTALAWVRSRSPRITPIVGARTVEQLRDNMACLNLRLSEAQLSRLDALTRPALGFPHDFLASPAITRLMEGQFSDRLVVNRRGDF